MWMYILLVVLPALLSYMFINRDGESFETAVTWSVGVLVVQVIFLIIGGWVGNSVVGVVFLFGIFLGYGRWYMKRVDQLVSIPVNSHVVFNYRDRKFNLSKRRVKVDSFDNTYFTGLCDTRKAERTFRRDRVQNGLVIEETGEIIDPMAHAHPDLHKK